MYIYHHICLDPRAIVMKLDLLWQTLLWPALIRRITDSMNHGVCVYEPLVRWFIQRRNIWCHIWRNTCVYIYILWIIISYHIHFNSNFLFQGPGLCDFGISDMTWHLQTWKNSGCDGRKIPRHVVLPKFAGLVHEENIPRGRRSQWMNSKLGTHQNKIYKIEVPGVP